MNFIIRDYLISIIYIYKYIIVLGEWIMDAMHVLYTQQSFLIIEGYVSGDLF